MFTSHPTLLIGPSDWDAKVMPKEEFIRRIEGLWRMHPEAPCAIVYGDRCHNGELVYLTNLVPKLEAAVALLFPMDEHELYVGGGPNMLDAARPLTWITGLKPLRGGQTIGRRAAESRTILPGVPLLIGGGYMPTALRQDIVDAIGESPLDATADVWTLMRGTSAHELVAMYNTCLILAATLDAIASAQGAGAGVTDAILAGERAANDRGAQDVRTLFSVNGGRTLTPFTTPIEEAVDSLQVYVAVRRFNYWAEGFAMMSEQRRHAAEKAHELLRLALAAIKPGAAPAEVEKLIASKIKPYRCHPVTERSFANRIGLALEEPPHTNAGARFEVGASYSVKVGVTDDAQNHAIVSAMIAIHDDGIDLLWSGSHKPNKGSKA